MGRLAAVTLAFAIALIAGASLAGDRVALVVGNQHYGTIGNLSTPINDATDIAADLVEAGFKVVTATDLDESAFAQQLSDFATMAEGADLAVFYYAGHGLQYKSENYLMPTDATLKNQFALLHETIRLSEVVDAMSGAHFALVYIDACRSFPEDAPFFANAVERITRVAGPALVTPPPDVFVGFSASPGQTASDGLGRNSPFAEAMLKFLPTPGLSLAELFSLVSKQVKAQSDGAQKPQGYGTIEAGLFIAPALPAMTVTPSPETEERAFHAAQSVATPGAFQAFLDLYPKGFYATLAREQLAKLVAQPDAAPPGPDDVAESGPEDPVALCDALAGDPTDPNRLGTGVLLERVDADAAVKACRLAMKAQPFEPRLQYQYGRALMVAGNDAAAFGAFQAAASRDYAEAMTSAARALREGEGIPRDVPAAIALMKRAAAKGSSTAMTSLGVMYASGTLVPRNDDVAFRWHKQAADLNDPLGLNNLASMYRDGRGVPRNTAKATELYERAVDLDYAPAMYNLAMQLEAAVLFARNPQREAALLLRAINLDPEIYAALVRDRKKLGDDTVRSLQTMLQQRGQYIGEVDGVFGPETRAALEKEIGKAS